MPKYVVEREFSCLTAVALMQAGRRSVQTLKKMGGKLQWVQSYVTSGKLYSIYIASSEREIRSHARASGLPCTAIRRVEAVVDPSLFGA